MRYIVDIPKWLDNKIKRILEDESKDFAGIDEFVVVACENQVKLEGTEGREIAVGITYEKATHAGSMSRLGPADPLLTGEIEECAVVRSPDSEDVGAELLWGQVYRIFPIKLGARVLANMIANEGEGYVKLDEFAKTAADVAYRFGRELKEFDIRRDRKPGEKLSTGLPVSRHKKDISKKRYRAHYLAYRTTKGKLVGALVELGLANLDNDHIGITEDGLKFARLKNPLMDEPHLTSDTSLSEDESSLYLTLLDDFLPDEASFMRAVLNLIKSGEPPRDEFNSKVKAIVEDYWGGEITQGVANTMRSGVLSRMWELDLVVNKRFGRMVVYSITEKGLDFLESEGGR